MVEIKGFPYFWEAFDFYQISISAPLSNTFAAV